MSERPEAAINTRSGLLLDFKDPSSDSIKLCDIAAGLSLAPRFGGQALWFRSVAEHAVCVAQLVEAMGHPKLAFIALHHDSHEAYACDIPKPLKTLLEPAYGDVTDQLDLAISKALGFDLLAKGSPEDCVIKEADDAVLILEAGKYLAGEPPRPNVSDQVLALAEEEIDVSSSLASKEAKNKFLERHYAYEALAGK